MFPFSTKTAIQIVFLAKIHVFAFAIVKKQLWGKDFFPPTQKQIKKIYSFLATSFSV